MLFVSVIAIFIKVVAAFSVRRSSGGETGSNKLGQNTIVLAAPSIFDEYYKDKFPVLVDFYNSLVQTILDTDDNVVLLVDKHTLPFFDSLPKDVVLEADIYDIFIRDYAPNCQRDPPVRFRYDPLSLEAMTAYQIDESFKRFMEQQFMQVDQSDIALVGTDIVDNMHSKALINKRVLEDNRDLYQDWAIEIKLRNIFGDIALIQQPRFSMVANWSFTVPLGRLMTFIEPELLVMAKLEDSDSADIAASMKKVFRDTVQVIEIEMPYVEQHWKGRLSSCGMFTTMLATNNTIYVPVFGNDPLNWNLGYSSMTDRRVLQMMQVSSKKRVIGINIPHAICEIGGDLQSLTWLAQGSLSDHMVNMAKMKAKLKALKNAQSQAEQH